MTKAVKGAPRFRGKWMLLAAASALSCSLVAVATPASAQSNTISFDIRAQPLAQALMQLSRQANVNVIAPSDLTRGRSAPAVRGPMSVPQALDRLLAGSGLTYRSNEGGSIVIQGTPGSGEAEAGGAAADSGSAEEIVVTGTNIRGGSPASPVIRISRRQIEESGAGTVVDVVRTLPQNFNGGQNATVLGAGANAQENGNFTGGSTVNLRGLGSSSTLTLVNGHRLASNGFNAGSDISVIPLSAVERVEVLTDGASAIYGSDAIAGVVNFILRDRYDGLEMRARVGAATEGGGFEQQYGGLFGQSWSSGAVVLNVERRLANAVRAEDRNFTSLVSPGTDLLPRTRSTSFFGHLRQDLTDRLHVFIDGIYARHSFEQTQTDPAFIVRSFSRSRTFSGTAGVNWQVGGDWEISASATYARDDTPFSFQFASPPGPLPAATGNFYDNRSLIAEASATGTLVNLPAGPLRIAVGGGYRTEDFEFLITSSNTLRARDRNIRYAFAEARVPLIRGDGQGAFNRLDLIAAARVEDYSDFGSTLNPKLGVVLEPFPALRLTASWGTSFRAPFLNDLGGIRQVRVERLTPPTPTGQNLVIRSLGGNPDLEPERSESWTFNATFTPSALSGFRASGTLYVVDSSDRIGTPFTTVAQALADPVLFAPFIIPNPTVAFQDALIATADPGRFRNTSGLPYVPANVAYALIGNLANIASRKATGVDLDISNMWTLGSESSLTAFASLSWLDLEEALVEGGSTVQRSGTVFYPPDFRSRAGLTWRSNGLSATAIVNHVGGSDNNVSPTQGNVDAWTTVDASIGYEFGPFGRVRQLRARASVQNLFNSNPPFVAPDSTTIPGLAYDSTNATPLGRFVSFELSVAF